jgi:hypothetical protein
MVLEAPVGPVMRVALAETEPLIPVAEVVAHPVTVAAAALRGQVVRALLF